MLITFSGITNVPSDHDNHDGEMDMLVNLLPADGALRPVSAPESTTPDAAAERAEWSERTGMAVNAVVHTDGMTCVVGDTDIIYAMKSHHSQDDLLFRRSDLLYEVEVSQDQQVFTEVTAPLTDSLLKYLQQPTTMVSGQQTTVARLFPYEADGTTTVTGMTMALAAIESAIDQMLATLHAGWHKHVSFGMAVLRLFDGTLLHCSNLFALLPASRQRVLTADVQAARLDSPTYLHTHQVTVSMRGTLSAEALQRIVKSVEIYLTPPVSLTSVTAADELVTDGEGVAIRITYAQMSEEDMRSLPARLPLRHALSISPSDFGTPVLLPRPSSHGKELSLTDLRRASFGARAASCYEGRLCIGQVGISLPPVFRPVLRYRYPTLTASERLALSEEEREQALRGEHLCGIRADIDDRAEGHMADVVARVSLSVNGASMTISTRDTLPYPLAGVLMYPDRRAYAMELYVHLGGGAGNTTGTDSYWYRRVGLEPSSAGDYSLGLWSAEGGGHNSEGVTGSLLWQQVRTMVYDTHSGSYRESRRLFTPIDEETFMAAAGEVGVSTVWEENLLLTSERQRVLDFNMNNGVVVGNGAITALSTNTKRFTGVQFGAYPLLVLTSEGVWALQSGTDGGWRSKYLVSQTTTIAPENVLSAADGVFFWNEEGLMSLSGSQLTFLWRGAPMPLSSLLSRLPRWDDIIETVFGPEWRELISEAFGSAVPSGTLSYSGQNVYWRMNEHLQMVYSLREKSWGSVLTSGTEGEQHDGSEEEEQHDGPEEEDGEVAVLALTRPLHFGDGHRAKRLCACHCCGLFREAFSEHGSRLRMAVWGSNDLYHWHIVGTSRSHFIHGLRGTPFRHYRVMVAGWMRREERLKGVRLN